MQKILTPSNLCQFYQYELQLARAFHAIEQRGVLVDTTKLGDLHAYIHGELSKLTIDLSNQLNMHVAFSQEQATSFGWRRQDYINLASPADILKILKAKGLKVPKNRMTGRETTGEDALNQIYTDTGDPIIRSILHGRELIKIQGYVNIQLDNGVLYSSYRVTGTVTGRRSASKNLFGYGTNHQNLPKHSELGRRFRSCIRARDGNIFINCDQVQAEDWIVSGIIADVGGDFHGLNELRSGEDRHTRLASKLFSKPESECGKDTIERFMGKKVRHAGNYDMGPDEFARQLVKEGMAHITAPMCDAFLYKFHKEEPGIRGVFHKYIQQRLESTRTLLTPLGRERVFFGCRPYGDNKKVFKEAYSFIPQSTVGDNTGLGILSCERNWPGMVILDTHDAITLEVRDTPSDIERGIELLLGGFDREICFPNGLTIRIPVEIEIGHSLGEMKCLKFLAHSGVT